MSSQLVPIESLDKSLVHLYVLGDTNPIPEVTQYFSEHTTRLEDMTVEMIEVEKRVTELIENCFLKASSKNLRMLRRVSWFLQYQFENASPSLETMQSECQNLLAHKESTLANQYLALLGYQIIPSSLYEHTISLIKIAKFEEI